MRASRCSAATTVTKAGQAAVVTLCMALLLGSLLPDTARAARVPIISGHRGTLVGAPESTMAAFRYAKAHGANAVELDVRWTWEGRMVVLHDEDLRRTTNCAGPVESTRFASLMKCDAGSWYGRRWKGTRVPTFAAVLEYVKRTRMQLNPEVKRPKTGRLTTKKAHELVERIYDYGMQSRTGRVLHRPHHPGHDQEAGPRRKAAVRPDQPHPQGRPGQDRTRQRAVYMAHYRSLTPTSARRYQRAGVALWIWPTRSRSDFDAVFRLGPDVIVTDDPAAARRWLTARLS
jgi:glycerophosphoryl diester phosphodiesterase